MFLIYIDTEFLFFKRLEASDLTATHAEIATVALFPA